MKVKSHTDKLATVLGAKAALDRAYADCGVPPKVYYTLIFHTNLKVYYSPGRVCEIHRDGVPYSFSLADMAELAKEYGPGITDKLISALRSLVAAARCRLYKKIDAIDPAEIEAIACSVLAVYNRQQFTAATLAAHFCPRGYVRRRQKVAHALPMLADAGYNLAVGILKQLDGKREEVAAVFGRCRVSVDPVKLMFTVTVGNTLNAVTALDPITLGRLVARYWANPDAARDILAALHALLKSVGG